MVRKFLNGLLDKKEYLKQIPIITKSLEKVKNINNSYSEAIRNCLIENLFNILQFLVDNKEDDIKSNNQFLFEEIVQFLREQEINSKKVTEDGQNALHLASEKGHKEIVKLLIQKGIDHNKTNKVGNNALHWK